jgi:iron complex transport system ATP-binding protein
MDNLDHLDIPATPQRDRRDTVIGLKGVTLKRGGLTLIDSLDWLVQPGQNWVLLGPNGAGKTLILRLVTGYIWPTLGKVTVLGHTLGTIDLRILRRKIGWVSQAVADLMPGHTTLLETILSGPMASLGLYDRPWPGLEEKALGLAEKYGLADKLSRPFALLSSGERQKVLLARAILADPRLLILDEPMSNLDMGGREIFINLLRDLSLRPGAPCLVLTTHSTLEIGDYFSHALIIKSGGLLAAGPIEEALSQENLSAAFNLPLKVERSSQGRWIAFLE